MAKKQKAVQEKPPTLVEPASVSNMPVAVEIMRASGFKDTYICESFKVIQVGNSLYEWSEDKDCLYYVKVKNNTYPANFFYEANPKAQPIKQGIAPAGYVYNNYLLDGRALLQRLEQAAWGIGEWQEGSKERLVTEGNFKWIIIMVVVIVVAVIAAFVLGG
jgi:hypothetical protein